MDWCDRLIYRLIDWLIDWLSSRIWSGSFINIYLSCYSIPLLPLLVFLLHLIRPTETDRLASFDLFLSMDWLIGRCGFGSIVTQWINAICLLCPQSIHHALPSRLGSQAPFSSWPLRRTWSIRKDQGGRGFGILWRQLAVNGVAEQEPKVKLDVEQRENYSNSLPF